MTGAKRVLVAMSGGVDSSVAALLLKNRGYEVVGVHMKLWDHLEVGGDIYRDGRCCSLDSITDCRFVCDAIGAPFYVLNLSEQFACDVIEDFVSEYRAGRTPNPCVRCNSEIKWKALLHKADELGCDVIATGHYAQVTNPPERRWQIRKGVDSTRDQSYVLWGLTQSALARTLMPLGTMKKTEVRTVAEQHGLRTAGKSESREICFVADDDYRRFLREYEARRGRTFESGEIVRADGRVLGQHSGTAFYTIGQRRGLGIAHPTPLYVLRIDAGDNRIVVGDDSALHSTEMTVEPVNWVARAPGSTDEEFKADVKIRYLHDPARARVKILNDRSVSVSFQQPQRAITPGQSAVFYEDDVVLGGGLIRSSRAV
ncbi:MAG: tRNA 2-thiouridine(34) synthase MnmA [Candidatus Zixiibacteriota bacterium]|nr:MAG: tRNA 2-thiouridine(34) synthase MnmA [candidate division Zixibacteria bacterium]